MLKKNTTKITIIFVCLILMVVGYFAYLSNKDQKRKADASMTAVQSVLSRNLELDYPATPKEVIKYYNEIMKCFYNEDCEDSEIDELGMKARELYDAELLAANETGSYLINLRADIKDYREHKRKITYINLSSSINVDFFEEDGYSFARIACNYTIAQDGVNNPANLVYLLRRDEEKRWKIYGWTSAENVTLYKEEAITQP